MFEARHKQNVEAGSAWSPPDFQAEVLEALRERVARTGLSGGKLIEFGCATGEIVRGFLERGWEATGVDISPTAVAAARERGPGEFLVHDLSQPLAASLGPFDVVLDGYAYHFQIGDARKVYLANARRCLRPDGWLVLNSNVGDPMSDLIDFDPETRVSRMDGVPMNYYAELSELEDELREAGFAVVESEVFEGQARIGVVWATLPSSG
jgi:SAM-dependent methyltransferase